MQTSGSAAPPTTSTSIYRLTAEETAARVEPVVLDLIDAHETLITALERHRDAITAADPHAIAPLIEEERGLFARLLDLDKRLRAGLGHTSAGGMRLSELAEHVPGVDGERLADSAAYLRTLATRAEILRSSVRDASAAMAAHLDGLMRQVAQRLSHAGTYGSAGQVESKASVVSGLDVSL